MPGLVDAQSPNMSPSHVNLVDAARLLCKPPIARQRLVEKLKQQSSVYAVMTDENDRISRMMPENEAQRIGSSSDQILQRLATGKPNEMWRCKPCGEKLRIGLSHLIVSLRLPDAVIDVGKIVDDFSVEAAGFSNRGPRLSASPQRTYEDFDRAPCGCDSAGNRLRPRSSTIGQSQVGATAKPLRSNALDVAVPYQENLRHRKSLSLAQFA